MCGAGRGFGIASATPSAVTLPLPGTEEEGETLSALAKGSSSGCRGGIGLALGAALGNAET